MLRRTEHLSCEARLRELGLLRLEEALGDSVIAAFQYLKGDNSTNLETFTKAVTEKGEMASK